MKSDMPCDLIKAASNFEKRRRASPNELLETRDTKEMQRCM